MNKHVIAYAVLGTLAIGTTSATAASLITGAQVRNNSLTGFDVRSSSLDGTDIRNGTIRPSDLSSSAKTAGPAGAQGPAGPAGIASLTVVDGAEVNVPSGEVGGATATCPAGTAVSGTGFNASIGFVGFVKRFGNFVGIGVINDTTLPIAISAEAICASGPGVTLQRLSTNAASGDFARSLAALRSSR
jgi:hypothetical protein